MCVGTRGAHAKRPYQFFASASLWTSGWRLLGLSTRPDMISPAARPAAVGVMIGTPDSARKVPGMHGQSLHRDEQAAMGAFALPQPVLANDKSSKFDNRFQCNDEPSSDQVWSAMHKPPSNAPTLHVVNMPQRQGNVLNSPRRTAGIGETLKHASPWRQPGTFTLSTPYAMQTEESRFAEFDATKASLAAVAHTAGVGTAAPTAGMSTRKKNGELELPSMRNVR